MKTLRMFPILGLSTIMVVLLIAFSQHIGRLRANGGVCNVPTALHPTIQSAVDDVGCDIVNLTTPYYEEDIVVARDVTIQGQGSANTTWESERDPYPGGHLANHEQGTPSMVTITGGATVILQDFTLANGRYAIFSDESTVALENLVVTGFSATPSNTYRTITNDHGTMSIQDSLITQNGDFSGGGVRNEGYMTVTNTVLSYNYSTGSGAAITNFGVLTVTNSTIHHNQSGGWGGGISSHWISVDPAPDATLLIQDTSIFSNQAGLGGGISLGWARIAVIQRSTIYNNVATANGGGLGQWMGYQGKSHSLQIYNSTISGNLADEGGGISLGTSGIPELIIVNSTIYMNQAASAGDSIFLQDSIAAQTIANVILANRDGFDSCFFEDGSLLSSGNNLVSDASCGLNDSNDIIGLAPVLGPLADNGGATLTHALLFGSPADGQGSSLFCAAAPVSGVDQRGYPRSPTACDIGAFEALFDLNIYLPIGARP